MFKLQISAATQVNVTNMMLNQSIRNTRKQTQFEVQKQINLTQVTVSHCKSGYSVSEGWGEREKREHEGSVQGADNIVLIWNRFGKVCSVCEYLPSNTFMICTPFWMHVIPMNKFTGGTESYTPAPNSHIYKLTRKMSTANTLHWSKQCPRGCVWGQPMERNWEKMKISNQPRWQSLVRYRKLLSGKQSWPQSS